MLLRYPGDSPAEGPQRRTMRHGHIGAKHRELAACWSQCADQQSEEGGLATSTPTEKPNDFTGSDGYRDVSKSGDPVWVALSEPIRGDNGNATGGCHVFGLLSATGNRQWSFLTVEIECDAPHPTYHSLNARNESWR